MSTFFSNKYSNNLRVCGYNRSIYKEIYAIGQNDMIRYKWEFVITEFVINGFNCT